jgi:hypothetical protein
MNKVVFYHVCLINRWKEIVVEQLYALQQSLLLDNAKIKIGVYYLEESNLADFKDLIQYYNFNNAVEIIFERLNDEHVETATTLEMKKYCDALSQEEANNTAVLFMHSKGVKYTTPPQAISVKLWRNYLEYFTITKWRDCEAKLIEGSKSCGVEWRGSMGGHYSGAFFWMQASLIREIPEIKFTIEAGWTQLSAEAIPGVIQHSNYDFSNFNLDLQNINITPSTYIK